MTDNEENRLVWLSAAITSLSKVTNSAVTYLFEPTKVVPNGNQFKLNTLPLLHFNGDPRYFPRFKKEFSELVWPQLSEDQKTYMLRKCLGERVEEIFRSWGFDI